LSHGRAAGQVACPRATAGHRPLRADPTVSRAGERLRYPLGIVRLPVLFSSALGLASVLFADGLAAIPPQQVFRSGVDVVNLGVAVMDKQGTAVAGLTRDDFTIFEEGKKQDIRYFAAEGAKNAMGADGERPPLHIGLVFDTSGSMASDMDLARSAAIRFLNRLPRAEDMTIVDFDTEVRTATYTQNDFTRLVARLRGRRPDGWTALWDAVGIYLGGAQDQSGQKVLIIFTDGGDTRSTLSYVDLLTAIKASDVSIYAIGFLEHQPASVRTSQRLQIAQLAELTGGQAYFPASMKDVEAQYDRIVAEIDSRYLLGYVSSDKRTDGAWRSVEVKLTRPDLRQARIRTRKGYFAPYMAPPKTQP
jgi:Ca-activated chloride channel family protein